MNKLIFKDLGLIDFKEAWDYQEGLFNGIIQNKLNNTYNHHNGIGVPNNHVLFCEHPHVYTLGKSGSESNLLVDTLELQKIEATFYKINRGGDITYHGPGQIVGYPIIDLEHFKLDIKTYIYLLEEAIILSLNAFDITCERLEKATGVWIDTGIPSKARKICAIGVKASRYVTMHGFALNVNTNLDYFKYINPCGFTDKDVTSMEKEIGNTIDIECVKNVLKENLLKVFCC